VPKSGSGLPSIVTSASFDSTCANPVTCNQPNSTTDARGNVTDYTYDSTHGGVLAVTAPAPASGAVRPQTRYSYTLTNGEYRLTGTSTCQTGSSCTGTSDEVVTSVAYDASGNVTSASSGNGAGTLTARSDMTYDAAGNLLTVDGPLSGSADTVRMRYDSGRRLIGTVSPDPDGGGTLKPRATRNTYADGLLVKVEQGNVASQSDTDWAAFTPLQEANTVYDVNARPVTTHLAAGGTTYAVSDTLYDSLGRVDCSVQRMDVSGFAALAASSCGSATGRIARTTYDAAGRVYQQVSAYNTPDQATDATYLYTNDGQLASVTDAEGNKTSYGYDGFDRRDATLYPNATKGSNTSNSSDVELSTLDAAGNVTAFTNRANQTIGFTYDALNRLTAKDLPDSGTYIFDEIYSYDNLGRMKAAGGTPTNPTIAFTWDALGRLTKDDHVAFGAKTFDYDLAGRRTRMTWRDGFYVDYDYFVTGETAAIRENGATSGVGVLATFGYDDLGRRTSLLRGNGTSTTYTPDPVSRLSALANTFPADTSKNLSLGFSYNAASQIVQNIRGNDLYSWAGHGNGNTVSSVNGLNQLTAIGALTPGYDAKGNMTSDGTSAYTYASDNRLATGKGLALVYDALGRLTWIQNDPRLADYSGSDVVAELATVTYAIQRRFVYGPGTDEPLVWYEGSGTTDRRFLHADERGSIVAISNSSGTVTNVNTYDEYGKPGAGNVGRFQYTGQKWYGALGLYDYKARMYHPGLGRFMQTDPIGFGDGLNLYGYVGGDSVNAADPTGTETYSSRKATWIDNDDEWAPGRAPGPADTAGGHSYDGMGTSDLVRMAGGRVETLAFEREQHPRPFSPKRSSKKSLPYNATLLGRITVTEQIAVNALLSTSLMQSRMNDAWQQTLVTGFEHGFFVQMSQNGSMFTFKISSIIRGDSGSMAGNFDKMANQLSAFWLTYHSHPGNYFEASYASIADQRFNQRHNSIGIIQTRYGTIIGH